MKNSRRMKRMSRNRQRVVKMNLTSLMDVFTILVFFLLVNSANTEVLETPKQIILPDSVVEEKPRETVVIFVSLDEVTVQGESVARVEDILATDRQNIGSIGERLAELTVNGTDLSARIVTSRLSAMVFVLRPMMFALISASLRPMGSMFCPSPAMMSSTSTTLSPCTVTSVGLTKITTVSRGLSSTIDVGSLICFGVSSTSVVAELTSRKKTRIVNTSIREVRFIFTVFARLRDMRFILREFFMARLQSICR